MKNDLLRMAEKWRAREARLTAWLQPLVERVLAGGRPVELWGWGNDNVYVVHRGLRQDPLRITHFAPYGPTGHTEHATVTETVHELVTWARLTGKLATGVVDAWSRLPEWAHGLQQLQAVQRAQERLDHEASECLPSRKRKGAA